MAIKTSTALARIEARAAVYRSRAETAVARGWPVELVRDELRVANILGDLLNEIRKLDEMVDENEKTR